MTTAIIDMQKCDPETAQKRRRQNESNIVHVIPVKNERTTLVTLILIPLCLVVETEIPIFAVMCRN